jgi:hypothetical protein
LLVGVEVHGWLVVTVLLAQGGVSVIAGIGLLRRHRGALALALGVYVFGLLNFAAMTVMPGGLSRAFRAYQ